MSKIAFIGLGNMGGPMAINLAKAGHQVHAFDLSADAVGKVRDQGVPVAASARDAVADARVVRARYIVVPAQAGTQCRRNHATGSLPSRGRRVSCARHRTVRRAPAGVGSPREPEAS